MEKWLTIDKQCPGCLTQSSENLGQLDITRYVFGQTLIDLPEGGIDVFKCRNCKLVYKARVPSPEFLTEVMEAQAGDVWNDAYDFGIERQFIERFRPLDESDVLDIGPGNGQFLRACNHAQARRSGLDIYAHPGLNSAITGEFIAGLVDDRALNWSGQTYDIVTMYDVLEHLYSPRDAFHNVNRFLKPDGIVVIETGDVDCHWAQRSGVPSWWYLCRFEHHVFWGEEAIKKFADQSGFDVTFANKIKSKAWSSKSLKFKLVQSAAYAASQLTPKAYQQYCQRNDKAGITNPAAPFMKDHLLIVLTKRGDRGSSVTGVVH